MYTYRQTDRVPEQLIYCSQQGDERATLRASLLLTPEVLTPLACLASLLFASQGMTLPCWLPCHVRSWSNSIMLAISIPELNTLYSVYRQVVLICSRIE